jgi:hypothetical protein
MPKTRIDLTKLNSYFASQPERVFVGSDLSKIFMIRSKEWNLPASMTPRAFIEILVSRTKMSEVKLTSPLYPGLVRYVWGPDLSQVSIALSVRRDAYYSHGSAMWIHGLGGNAREMFVNSEQTEKAPNKGLLTQDSIHRAFRKEQRQSRLIYHLHDTKITVLNGKNTGRLEVQTTRAPSGERVDVTSLERTLIDITVRPAYAGGVLQVMDAFRLAHGRASINKLLSILKKLGYKYPVHQSIGFYLKRTGYSETDRDSVRQLGTRFDFYLCYGLKDPAFDTDWKIFFPRTLE